jgi:hypothetical protein
MVHRKMRDPMDDIAAQARQGSVAAIIQTLNERLADEGVRTRAVFADGILQLLCEAALPEQLDQSAMVAKIQQILEEISPRNIRRVHINSRIVREQQLLWLEEINRDPDSQLLWSQEIVLNKPHLFKQLANQRQNQHNFSRKNPPLPSVSSRYLREKKFYTRGIASGVSLTLFLLGVGWLLHQWFTLKINPGVSTQSFNSSTQSTLTPTQSPTPASSSPTPDPFAQAVRIAEQASTEGKTVKTSAQWLSLAAKWERASDLMKAVKPDDHRYKTAQDRVILYRQNSEAAQQQAAQSRS